MTPRYGEPRVAGVAYQLRAGAYAILQRNRKLLLTFQDGTDEPLQLPGGGIDPGESPIRALHREVMEETGWRIAAPRRFGTFRRFVFMPEYEIWAEKICHIFVARPVVKTGPPSEPGHYPIWADPHAVVDRLSNPGDQQMLARALGVKRK